MLKTSLKRHPSCFDNNFKYTPASQTDLAKTFVNTDPVVILGLVRTPMGAFRSPRER